MLALIDGPAFRLRAKPDGMISALGHSMRAVKKPLRIGLRGLRGVREHVVRRRLTGKKAQP